MDSAAQIEHYNAILIEDLRSQFRLVIEHVQTASSSLGERIDRFEQKTESRFEIIETILRQHSEILNEHSRILDEHSGILNEHSGVLRHLAKGMDALSDQVERQDGDIVTLKEAVFSKGH